ncbi:hypothetical protein EV363DRAFT_1199981, partial [Boletus edulis]
LVAEISTLRRHLQSCHRAEYLKWASDNNFTSMLPKDRKSQKEDVPRQTQLDGHLQPPTPKYSDERFRAAAVEWLVNTDQPISALEHPSFKKLVDVVAQATNGVKVPNRKYTRTLIIDTFKEHMLKLHTQLLVCKGIHHA